MQTDASTQIVSGNRASTVLDQLLELFELQYMQPDHYIGQSLDLGFRNLFGGHILGQALVAAGNTCDQRNAHSLHAYFIRDGDPRLTSPSITTWTAFGMATVSVCAE
jgi:hypothetical protein